MIKHELFPTLVCTFQYDKHKEFKELFNQNYLKYGHYNDDGVFVTGESEGFNKVHHEPAFVDFYDFTTACMKLYLMEMGVNLDNFYIVIGKSWLSFCDMNREVPPHNHGDHHLSFIYYVNAPDNCDFINFKDTRVFLNEPFYPAFSEDWGEPRNITEVNKYNTQNHFFQPKQGDLFIFPSKLNHYTTKFKPYEGVRQALAADYLLIYKNVNNKNPWGIYTPDNWKWFS
jgi:hypothetical protein